ncbi:MAG: tRNA lysidine(34) synthetase TilS, partial [Bdellovibrionales bacterium]|nr:tRNA lysidine(34) synthetase TilS [Bdellovibrionales bacterium]
TALAWLIGRYGRRVVGPERITLVHFHHGWRGREADRDARRVRELASRLGVKFLLRRLSAEYLRESGRSWEEGARAARLEAWERLLARRPGGTEVWTAHQADDLAETVIWRLCTGSAGGRGGGILFATGPFRRPLLNTRRAALERFLREEGLNWGEDPTNRDDRFLRGAMRNALMPALEKLFPKAVEHLAAAALGAQSQRSGDKPEGWPWLTRAADLPLRGSQIKEIQRSARKGNRSVPLPGGWSLRWERVTNEIRGAPLTSGPSVPSLIRERWVLERAERSPTGH